MVRIDRGAIFVGMMFLGMGIGMFFDRAGEGTILGLGAGFIAMALVPEHEEERGRRRFIHHWSWASSIVLGLIGLGFILWGLYMLGLLTIPAELGRIIGGVVILLIGLGFIAVAVERHRVSRRSSGEGAGH